MKRFGTGFLALSASFASAITLQTVGSGLARPITLAYAPGDSSRYFVVEQRSGTTGRIRVVKNGTVLTTPFLSVSGVSTGGEQGLLGMAFHPQYPTTPYFYVNLTNASGHTEIRRYQVSTANPDVAMTSGTLVMVVTQPYANHNGGTLEFGPDGFLYIGMGDGGSGNDPENRAQNLNSLLGKFLRIDVDRDDFPLDSAKNYGIPTGNMAGALPEIWSYGWRNPWQWSFDQPGWNGFGGKWVADVGQGSYEEVSYEPGDAPAGLNYGWRVKEGFHDTGLGGGSGPFVPPLLEYDHSGGCSISGGVLYRGVRLGPEMYGRYFYSDYCTPTLWSVPVTLNPATGAATVGAVTAHATLAGGISAIRADATGELYAMTTGASFQKITDVGKAIQGRVIFTGAPDKARWVTMVLREAGTTPEYRFTLQLKADGSYRIPAWAKNYTLSVKKDHWLNRKINVSTTAGDVSGADLVLVNGDVDGDNVVSIADYIVLSDSFDLAVGDPGFAMQADLDEDGVISVFDYIILSDNFDNEGDPL